MSGTDRPQGGRVRSGDGTEIAYWTSGEGPPLVLVHGVAADHTRWGALLPFLEPHFTVHAIDRRGRGGSGDAGEYALTREFEDIAAVVEELASGSGAAVDVYGHSHGGVVAFGSATLTRAIRRLVLYEGWPVPDPAVCALPPGLEARLDTVVRAGDRDAAVELVFRELLQMSDEDVAQLRAAPSWSGRVAAVQTLTREVRAELTARLDPEVAAAITVPVLLLTGQNSSDPSKAQVDAVAAALPDARVVVLKGQEHAADVTAPELVAEQLSMFLPDDRGLAPPP